jgi:hypothetical protein
LNTGSQAHWAFTLTVTPAKAKLVKYLQGKLELKGGSKEDHGEAMEWMSLFWHEAVMREI